MTMDELITKKMKAFCQINRIPREHVNDNVLTELYALRTAHDVLRSDLFHDANKLGFLKTLKKVREENVERIYATQGITKPLVHPHESKDPRISTKTFDHPFDAIPHLVLSFVVSPNGSVVFSSNLLDTTTGSVV